MTKFGTCALCEAENAELQHSHIVSEHFYKEIYTSSHRFKPIKVARSKRTQFEQKGYREHLLCFHCEQMLAVWEGELKKFFDALSGNPSPPLRVNRIEEFLVIEKFEYDHVKKGLLSILWRMGISSYEVFESYDLGPYSELLRNHLLSSVEIPEQLYPVLIYQALLNGAHQKGMMMTIHPGRYNDHVRLQSVLLSGHIIDVQMKEYRSLPTELEYFVLSPAKPLLVPQRHLGDFNVPLDQIHRRIKEAEFQEFLSKHHDA